MSIFIVDSSFFTNNGIVWSFFYMHSRKNKFQTLKENEENADTNQSEQSILIYLTSECLHAQLALRIGDVINDTDAWYESELPSIVGK